MSLGSGPHGGETAGNNTAYPGPSYGHGGGHGHGGGVGPDHWHAAPHAYNALPVPPPNHNPNPNPALGYSGGHAMMPYGAMMSYPSYPPNGLAMAHAGLAGPGGYDEEGPEPRKVLTLRLLGRTLSRYWWQILLLWILGCGTLMALTYTQVKPVFHAAAQIEVKPEDAGIFDRRGTTTDHDSVIQTQVQLMTNTRVLSAALADRPDLANFPLFKDASDMEAEIRKHLKVMHVPKTLLIQVGMSSENPTEAAEVINTVVKAFVKTNQSWTEQETKAQIERFTKLFTESKNEVERKRAEVQRIANQLQGGNDLELVQDQNKMSLERFNKLYDDLFETRIQRHMKEALVDRLRANAGLALNPTVSAGGISDEDLRIELQADPTLNQLSMEVQKAQRMADEAKRRSRDPNDPARVSATRRAEEITDELDRQTAARIVALKRRYAATPNVVTEDTRDLRAAEAAVEQLKAAEMVLSDRLSTIKLDKESAGDNTTKLIFARTDLARAEQNLDTIQRKLDQLEFDAKTPSSIQVRSDAKPNGNNRTDQRIRIMALIPFAWGSLVVGLFLLLEIRAGRIADPEEIPDRVRVPVIGIVPPLPALTSGRTNGLSPKNQIRAQRQIDVFIQCLDHLRVVLCTNNPMPGAAPFTTGMGPGERVVEPVRRCVLITSAVGSEGKSTLAAQLAGRCANAGLLTLLIDADLRNPSLSWMLDVEEGAGLSDVLRGDVEAETVIRPIGDVGGFHLLPAGAPQADPSRLLQSERLGQIMQRFRHTFDVVIVDAPPVLPVPDALNTARWTDGAILAVRHGTSRYSQVERARQRLAGVGISVLGAVVNGVRSAETSYGYGGYGYGYGASSSSPGPNPSPSPSHNAAASAP